MYMYLKTHLNISKFVTMCVTVHVCVCVRGRVIGNIFVLYYIVLSVVAVFLNISNLIMSFDVWLDFKESY
jgi:hypothetical protein